MRISIRQLEALKSNNERYFIWDDSLSGFGVRIEASGRITFLCRYRIGNVRRQYTLGRYGNITPDQARKEAKKLLGSVAMGNDPAAERSASRKAIIFSELFELFLTEHGQKLKKSSRYGYMCTIKKHALPLFGRYRAEDITHKELNRLHLSLADSPATANRLIAYIGSIFGWAERSGYIPERPNPARKIERFREKNRQRYLNSAELTALGKALHKAETVGLPWKIISKGKRAKHIPKNRPPVIYPKHVTNAIRLLLFTGCRRGEILNLQWSEVDTNRGLLFLSDSKTGQKTVILNGAAVAILSEMGRHEKFVVPGDIPGKARHDLKRPWDHIRTEAKLHDVRLHDLRHTHASIGVAAGFGLPIIGKLLGHVTPQTTQRYAHVADDPARRASNEIGTLLQGVLKGTQPNPDNQPIKANERFKADQSPRSRSSQPDCEIR